MNKYWVKISTDFSKAPDIDYVEAFLASIMKNLISNAIKYSAEVENPRVHIITKRENNYVLLIVRDNGIGINLDEAGENLFKPFKTLHLKSRRYGNGIVYC
ncbi:MAG: ATP-binding protein [Bacteroidales bacterium]|nr:ATP-binding protein [Bacteroidales bacterium]